MGIGCCKKWSPAQLIASTIATTTVTAAPKLCIPLAETSLSIWRVAGASDCRNGGLLGCESLSLRLGMEPASIKTLRPSGLGDGYKLLPGVSH